MAFVKYTNFSRQFYCDQKINMCKKGGPKTGPRKISNFLTAVLLLSKNQHV